MPADWQACSILREVWADRAASHGTSARAAPAGHAAAATRALPSVSSLRARLAPSAAGALGAVKHTKRENGVVTSPIVTVWSAAAQQSQHFLDDTQSSHHGNASSTSSPTCWPGQLLACPAVPETLWGLVSKWRDRANLAQAVPLTSEVEDHPQHCVHICDTT